LSGRGKGGRGEPRLFGGGRGGGGDLLRFFCFLFAVVTSGTTMNSWLCRHNHTAGLLGVIFFLDLSRGHEAGAVKAQTTTAECPCKVGDAGAASLSKKGHFWPPNRVAKGGGGRGAIGGQGGGTGSLRRGARIRLVRQWGGRGHKGGGGGGKRGVPQPSRQGGPSFSLAKKKGAGAGGAFPARLHPFLFFPSFGRARGKPGPSQG